MDYNDFSLPQNWERLAKAYSNSLKDKGFVFIRLDQNIAAKNHIASTCFLALKNLEIFYKQVLKRHSSNPALTVLEAFGKELSTYLEKFYIVQQFKKEDNKNNFNLYTKIFHFETKLIRNLVLLLEEEDDEKIRQFLKTNLTSRLETLEKTFV